jgi:hypothetical protein
MSVHKHSVAFVAKPQLFRSRAGGSREFHQSLLKR